MDPPSLDKTNSETFSPSPSNAAALPPQSCEQGRKRKLSNRLDDGDVEPEAKHQLIEAPKSIDKATELASPNVHVNILDLSDEILLLVFLHLNSNSLLLLSKVCTRLKRLVADKTLWTEADFTSAKLTTAEVQLRIQYLQPVTTKTLKLRGMTSVYPAELWNVPTLTPGILKAIETRCSLLECMELTEAYLDMNEISITLFPPTLRSLVFRKCALSVQNINNQFVMQQQQMRSFLSNMYKHLVRLEELTIEYCAWFDTHDFMVLSKLPNLRYLSLKGCANIKDSVPYASLATRFGFKKLEVLDLRDTPISDSDVSCFNIVHSLKELRLECPEHLRTERGLNEYNEAERQRVEQLHRLAMPDLLQNEEVDRAGGNDAAADPIPDEPPAEGVQLPPPIPRPRHGVFEIRIIHGDYPGYVRGNQDNLIRIVRDPQQPVANNPAVPAGPIANENNRQDRQNIVRIINRDLLLQRRENVHLNHPHRVFRRQRDQMQMMNAAQQRIFDAGVGNPAQRPRPEPPRPDRPGERAPAGPNPPVERHIQQPEGQLRLLDVPNDIPAPNQQQQQEQPPQQQQEQPPQQQQQPPPQQQQQQNNAPPQRVLPQVIIMPGNFQELIHRPINGNQHQIFVNLGIGQPAPNYVSLVSDRGICAYGVSRNEMAGALMEEILHHNLTGLERLSIRNYKLVTDTSLDHLESAAPHLKLLDVTGTSVTAQGIRNFKLSRPSCVVISDHDKAGQQKVGVVHSEAVSLDRL
ncbi:uncharacterized protein LOC118517723 [Anopheles stephensi]|uniref:uncharacterized protein LOC118517723 n=1 Tax=Anopheles stephensi TaxID=30069 RepID=UPI001658796C|nr:uncharacterized protein LOC118517723 [Anopheles stephensi]